MRVVRIWWRKFKIFLNLEKPRAAQRAIRNITKYEKSLTCHKRINEELFDFYKKLFSENLNVTKNEILQILDLIFILQLIEDQFRDWIYAVWEWSPPCFKKYADQ